MRPGNRLELLNTAKFPLERSGVFKRAAINDLDRPQRAQFVARQPNFPVAAFADGAEQFVIGNRQWRSCGVLECWSDSSRSAHRRTRHFWQSSIHRFADLATKRR